MPDYLDRWIASLDPIQLETLWHWLDQDPSALDKMIESAAIQLRKLGDAENGD